MASSARIPQIDSFRLGMFGLLLCGMSAGCGHLSFEKQTLVAAFAPQRDEIRILFVYEGLHVRGEKESDLNDAKNRLKELATGQTFDLSFFSFSLKDLSRDTPFEEDKRWFEFLKKHLSLRNGEFLNAEGKLSFYQVLTIREAQQFIKGYNEWLNAEFAKHASEGLALDRSTFTPDERQRWEKWDNETLRHFQAAAKEKHSWLRLDPGRLTLTLPGTEHYFTHLKREFFQKEFARFLSETPWSLEQRKNQLTISLGVGDGEPIRVVFENDKKEKPTFDVALLAYARSLPVKFSKAATTQRWIAELQRELAAKRE